MDSAMKFPENLSAKDASLELLDCLSSTSDQDDPSFNATKYLRKRLLLDSTSYSDLKVQLARKGLDTSGSQLEMLSRLLMAHIEPSHHVKFMSGREPTLQYISKEDIGTGKVVVNHPQSKEIMSKPIEAPDLIALRGFDTNKAGRNAHKIPKLMDSLDRRILTVSPRRFFRSKPQRFQDDCQVDIPMYIVGGRDVMKTWEKVSSIMVVVPGSDASWSHKPTRILADKLAYVTQALVILPDLWRNASAASPDIVQREYTSPTAATDRAFDDLLSTLTTCREKFDCCSFGFVSVGNSGSMVANITRVLWDVASAAHDFCGRALAVTSNNSLKPVIIEDIDSIRNDSLFYDCKELPPLGYAKVIRQWPDVSSMDDRMKCEDEDLTSMERAIRMREDADDEEDDEDEAAGIIPSILTGKTMDLENITNTLSRMNMTDSQLSEMLYSQMNQTLGNITAGAENSQNKSNTDQEDYGTDIYFNSSVAEEIPESTAEAEERRHEDAQLASIIAVHGAKGNSTNDEEEWKPPDEAETMKKLEEHPEEFSEILKPEPPANSNAGRRRALREKQSEHKRHVFEAEAEHVRDLLEHRVSAKRRAISQFRAIFSEWHETWLADIQDIQQAAENIVQKVKHAPTLPEIKKSNLAWFLSEHSSVKDDIIGPEELACLAPRCILLISPKLDESAFASNLKYLMPPTMLLLSDDQSSMLGSLEAQMEGSYEQGQLESYEVRVYKGMQSSFIVSPATTTERCCSHEAIAVGGMFLESSARDSYCQGHGIVYSAERILVCLRKLGYLEAAKTYEECLRGSDESDELFGGEESQPRVAIVEGSQIAAVLQRMGGVISDSSSGYEYPVADYLHDDLSLPFNTFHLKPATREPDPRKFSE